MVDLFVVQGCDQGGDNVNGYYGDDLGYIVWYLVGELWYGNIEGDIDGSSSYCNYRVCQEVEYQCIDEVINGGQAFIIDFF